jgi:hypothetical protein
MWGTWRFRERSVAVEGTTVPGCALLILETRGALESSAMRGWALSLYVTIEDATEKSPNSSGYLIRSAQRR